MDQDKTGSPSTAPTLGTVADPPTNEDKLYGVLPMQDQTLQTRAIQDTIPLIPRKVRGNVYGYGEEQEHCVYLRKHLEETGVVQTAAERLNVKLHDQDPQGCMVYQLEPGVALMARENVLAIFLLLSQNSAEIELRVLANRDEIYNYMWEPSNILYLRGLGPRPAKTRMKLFAMFYRVILQEA
ncbi:hypothetical protein HJFPF1_13619 [Paramyrothecium foliicola]|nr:hypothetical protein HJFPF1_13619 [Paramyrothecium foliicola]